MNLQAYALRSGMFPDRRRARRTASARLEVAMQSAFQAKFSYTMACWTGLLEWARKEIHIRRGKNSRKCYKGKCSHLSCSSKQ